MNAEQLKIFQDITLAYFAKMTPGEKAPVLQESYLQFDSPILLDYTSAVYISGSYEGLALHQIPEPIIEHDIYAFLTYELTRIRDDYNKSVLQDRHLYTDWPGQAGSPN